MALDERWRAITGEIVDAAMHVHSALGPGLLESAYRACLAHELRDRGVRFVAEVPLPVRYRDAVLDVGYRIDFLVEDVVVVEIKAVEKILPVHEAQVLSYLRLNDFRIGLLINFHCKQLRSGIRRFVNRL